jgi:hypothetical protein
VKVFHQTLVLPVSTLLFRQEGLRVVTVVHDEKNGDIAKLVPITIGQDDGRVVQVISGLQPDDEVVQNPPDSVIDGERVRIVTPNNGGVPGTAQPAQNPNQSGQGPEGGE